MDPRVSLTQLPIQLISARTGVAHSPAGVPAGALSKRSSKHAPLQQAKRRRKNTAIAASLNAGGAPAVERGPAPLAPSACRTADWKRDPPEVVDLDLDDEPDEEDADDPEDADDVDEPSPYGGQCESLCSLARREGL